MTPLYPNRLDSLKVVETSTDSGYGVSFMTRGCFRKENADLISR